MAQYVTPEVTRYIGAESDVVEAEEPVELGAVRRFCQAIMDNDPIYYDAAAAKAAGYPSVVAPPLFPLHAVRRSPGSPDPLDVLHEFPDSDGGGRRARREGEEPEEREPGSLPPLNIGLFRLLNGGNDVEIFDLARIGDIVTRKSRYADVYEKEGRTGPLVFTVTETEYRAKQGDRLLLKSRQTNILR